MNNNLLIVGAGLYGVVASEIARDMGTFEKIDFVDDCNIQAPNGIQVIGTTKELLLLEKEYSNIVVAIGNPAVRLSLLKRICDETPYHIVTLISPKAYISPSAHIQKGCIIEPMVVVHAGCQIGEGCIISAGAVVNHASKCCEGVHIDCNATVAGYTLVPVGTKICSGAVFKSEEQLKPEDVFSNLQSM